MIAFCTDCGFGLHDGAKFCPNCGKSTQVQALKTDLDLNGKSTVSTDKKEISGTFKIILVLVVLSIVAILTTKMNSNSDITASTMSSESSSNSKTSPDWLSRLNQAGDDSWTQDVVLPLNPPNGFITDYLAEDASDNGGCNLSIFNTSDDAEAANNSGLGVNLGYGWTGTDSTTGLGVILTADSSTNSCLVSAQKALG